MAVKCYKDFFYKGSLAALIHKRVDSNGDIILDKHNTEILVRTG